MDIKDVIKNHSDYLAHFKEDSVLGRYSEETLLDHSELVMHYYDVLDRINNIEDKIKGIIRNSVTCEFRNEFMNDKVEEFIYEMFVDAVYLHDIGKVNGNFQRDRMLNRKFISCDGLDSHHAPVSSLLYIEIYDEKVDEYFEDDDLRGVIREVMFQFSYVISKHHGSLGDMDEKVFVESLRKWKKAFVDFRCQFSGYLRYENVLKLNIEKLLDIDNYRYADPLCMKHMWLLNKMLFSSIVTSDFMATHRYMNETEPLIEVMDYEGVSRMRDNFENDSIIKNIRRFGGGDKVFDSGSINVLRSEMFLEAESNLIDNLDKHIYYLEAPTGSGKTLTSLNIVLKLLEYDKTLNKLHYIFSFNTLIDQTRKNFMNMLGEEFVVVNSLSEIRNNSDIESTYKELALQRQNMQYAFVMSSHVNLFNRMFADSRESNLSLTNLANSVIVLDEIQSYRNEIWLEIIEMISLFAKYLNIKIVIMSATLPNLSLMSGDTENVTELVKNREKYFGDRLFKNRVVVNYDLLENKYCRDSMDYLLDDFTGIYKKHGKVKYLIQFISKKSSRIFFNMVRDRFEGEVDVIEITGDDNRFYRDMMIDKIKSDNPIIVVATQVIEAGVDIDMDVGLKDVSMLDNEEQFLGRINRSCNREGIVYFFDLDDESVIYKSDRRVGFSVRKVDARICLENKNFSYYYSEVGKLLHDERLRNKIYGKGSLNDCFETLNFRGVRDYMKLINADSVQVFLDLKIKIGGIDVRGRDVWRNYVSIVVDNQLEYNERKVKLSQLKEKMSYFTYNIFLPFGKELLEFTYKFGEYRYVENADMYMDDFDGIKKLNVDRLIGNEGNGG